jgi:8-oxo-dGTP pyrophosphatase MutT (NUDIX family)
MHVNARAIIEKETPGGPEIVIQMRNKPHEGGKWIELPGGHVEEFESLIDALKREVHEETGLDVTEIEGEYTKVDTTGTDTNVECLKPLAVYQTTKGPVDSMGVYFRCKAEGNPLAQGDDTESVQWVQVEMIRAWLETEPERFSWIDLAGLLFYLKK